MSNTTKTISVNGSFSVGLTGGIGCGKTTVANFFAELGVSIIDTDLIAHNLTIRGGAAIPAIQKEFGVEFIAENGAMNRQKMREHVFKNPDAKQQLEKILHPQIRQSCETEAQMAQGSYLMFVVPLLVESGNWLERVQKVLVVDCAEETQIDRVIKRNRFNREQVLDIMRAQVTREKRLEHADDVINSEQDLSLVRQQVEQLHQKYLKLCKHA